MITIGEVAVVPADIENPYRAGVIGQKRADLLCAWALGEPTPGYRFWYAPFSGPSRELTGPEEIRAGEIEWMLQREGRRNP